MDSTIISIFNKVFSYLNKNNLKEFNDISKPKVLYEIGLEMDKNLFSGINMPITGGEDNLDTRISELTEISEYYLNISKPPDFIPTQKFKEEIELIDVIGLANKEYKNVYNFAILIIISMFFCKNKQNFIQKMKILSKNEKNFIFEQIQLYSNSSIDIIQDENNIENVDENMQNKLKDMEVKYSNLMKELTEVKNRNKELEKIISDKENEINLLNAQLLNIKKDTKGNDNIKANNEIIDYEKKYYDELKISENLKEENAKLNEVINIMTYNFNEEDNNNNKITNLEKDVKRLEKEKEELKLRFQKEFELMSSAIYNLGFQFWALKVEDKEKFNENESWLIKERIKQYNGDY